MSTPTIRDDRNTSRELATDANTTTYAFATCPCGAIANDCRVHPLHPATRALCPKCYAATEAAAERYFARFGTAGE